MLLQKPKKNSQQGKGSRLLITVNVLGSAGPLRFVVNEETLVATVIDTAIKSYAREGRLPVLGSDFNNFLLYPANAGSDALSQWEMIGSQRGRNFILCKKQLTIQPQSEMVDGKTRSNMISSRKGGNGSSSWKAWINKSLTFKISSH